MLPPYTINGKKLGAEHISVPTALAKATNKGAWYPNFRYNIYKDGKLVSKINHSLLHTSGNLVFLNRGYNAEEISTLKLIVIWFGMFDVYTIIDKKALWQPFDQVVKAYEDIGVKVLHIEDNITNKTGPLLDQLPKKPIIVGEQTNGYAVDMLGGFQVYNSYFSNYVEPYHHYKEYANFVRQGQKTWKDLLLTVDEIDYHTGFHTKPRKTKQYKF